MFLFDSKEKKEKKEAKRMKMIEDELRFTYGYSKKELSRMSKKDKEWHLFDEVEAADEEEFR